MPAAGRHGTVRARPAYETLHKSGNTRSEQMFFALPPIEATVERTCQIGRNVPKRTFVERQEETNRGSFFETRTTSVESTLIQLLLNKAQASETAGVRNRAHFNDLGRPNCSTGRNAAANLIDLSLPSPLGPR